MGNEKKVEKARGDQQKPKSADATEQPDKETGPCCTWEHACQCFDGEGDK